MSERVTRPADAAPLTAQYEALRARVVGDPWSGRPAHGLAVLLRSGMVAWLTHLQTHPIECDQPSLPERWQLPAVRSPAANGVMATTILILASMILAARMEQRHDHDHLS